MAIRKIETRIPGCVELQPSVLSDARGAFVKIFNRDEFASLGLAGEWAEQYYSHSKCGVLRGLHFQLPPYQHAKLVFCTAGEVLDVAVDLRKGSPGFGRHVRHVLSAERGNMLYLPTGVAHGFYAVSATTTLVYNVSSVYAPAYDTGIRWDSVGIDWPTASPELSDRDRAFVPFALFDSPFEYVAPVDSAS